MKKILFSILMLCCMTVAWAEGTGDGSKEHPFTGRWQVSEIAENLKKGCYLDLDCVIEGCMMSVTDIKLDQKVVENWYEWAPENLIINPQPGSKYEQYGDDNPIDNRKEQLFKVTSAVPLSDYSYISIEGYFTGFYRNTPEDDGFYHVYTPKQIKAVLQTDTQAKFKLMDDIYLTDIAVGTFCSTFKGTLDGDGHTIYGSHDGTRQNKTYLFTYSDGAIFKNLNFYNIRIDNRDNHNQAVITSQAMNGCVFENITFDKISTYVGGKHDNTGAAAAYATTNCTFTNITVKNSDFTADKNQSGCVVGHAMNCTFTNIKVEHCESTARNAYSGGVAGRADNCTFDGVEVLNSYILSWNQYTGGIAGYSKETKFENCTIDDQSLINAGHSNSSQDACLGGIAGYAEGGNIYKCINSALIVGEYVNRVGGIVGEAKNVTQIENCLNTGMVVFIASDVDDVQEYYSKYKNKQLPCMTKYYNGKEYIVRKTDLDIRFNEYYGGIVGKAESATITKCSNIGSMNETESTGGIVGIVLGDVTISDCFSDVHSPSSDIYGILAVDPIGGSPKIKNCVNVSGKKSCPDSTKATNLFTPSNDSRKLASGEAWTILGAAWEQNLGTDAYPTLGNKGLYHTRTVSNEYGTVCLPYPVQSDDNIRYYTFSYAYNFGGEVELRFEYADYKIPAGTPLLFRVRNTGENNFNNVAADSYEYASKPIEPENEDFSWNRWDLHGTFSKQEFTATAYDKYYVSNGAIRNANHTTVPAFRAYFTGPSISDLQGNGGSEARVRIVVEDEDGTTSIITPSEWSSLPSREGWGGSS
ncbi:MAG: hypothetical protein KBT29_04955, partial [Prevotellaceae bacterium]|nr:hypothetical protein [Candidatus Minthosoma caballi]